MGSVKSMIAAGATSEEIAIIGGLTIPAE